MSNWHSVIQWKFSNGGVDLQVGAMGLGRCRSASGNSCHFGTSEGPFSIEASIFTSTMGVPIDNPSQPRPILVA